MKTILEFKMPFPFILDLIVGKFQLTLEQLTQKTIQIYNLFN